MIDLLPVATAFVFGLAHSVDADHAMAVSTFISGRPTWPLAVRFGLRWGIGHSIAVLTVGTLLLTSGLRVPTGLDLWAERLVGLMLIGIGGFALWSRRNLHVHQPGSHGDHAHLHLHPDARPVHEHAHNRPVTRPHHHGPRGVTVVGLLHGLAGTSGALALIPVTLISDWRVGLAYLIAFCAGVTLGMASFALILAVAIAKATGQSVLWGRRIATGIALGSVATGVFWLVRAGGS